MRRHSLRTIGIVACLSGLAGAAWAADTLQDVLARMNQQAAEFRQVTAKLKKTSYTAILNDTSVESGAIWMRRAGRGIEMRGEVTGSDARSFGFRDTRGEIYYPNMNTVQIYDLGKAKSLVDQFMLLGFGSSGRDIERNYTVKLAGVETIGGRKTDRLELVPKSAEARQQVTRVDLWIPEDAGYPVQQKFYQPGGNYYLVVYSDIKVNPGLPDSDFRLKVPANAKKDRL
jgi:outer membrane lipoprotein-sorting protein